MDLLCRLKAPASRLSRIHSVEQEITETTEAWGWSHSNF